MIKTMNFWVELQEPDKNYTGEQICESANRMLKRLGAEDTKFLFNKNQKGTNACHYRLKEGNIITTLQDHGTWLNLEYCGREEE
tara:strand:+ start:252 stop:503 length:252 start_codon:yes stop_codon:yes gene_type:complete